MLRFRCPPIPPLPVRPNYYPEGHARHLGVLQQNFSPHCLATIFDSQVYLVDVSDIFFFSAWGRGRGSPRRRGVGGRFLFENPRRGVSLLGPRGREGVWANWGIWVGGGAKYFFLGPKCPPSLCPEFPRAKFGCIRWHVNFKKLAKMRRSFGIFFSLIFALRFPGNWPQETSHKFLPTAGPQIPYGLNQNSFTAILWELGAQANTLAQMSPKMPPKLSFAHKRGLECLFRNYPGGEGNCEAIERHNLSCGNCCRATSRCLFWPAWYIKITFLVQLIS